ncbi:hypothetical protein P7C70_g9238, partial [Phenoliferia sp. Uapishka_3]
MTETLADNKRNEPSDTPETPPAKTIRKSTNEKSPLSVASSYAYMDVDEIHSQRQMTATPDQAALFTSTLTSYLRTSFDNEMPSAASSSAITEDAAVAVDAKPATLVTSPFPSGAVSSKVEGKKPQDPLVTVFEFLRQRPLYWGNINWAAVKIKDARAWMETSDGKLPFLVIGKVYNNKLVKDDANSKVDAWMLDIERPSTIATNFNELLNIFKAQIRKKIKNTSLSFAGNEHGLRLARYYKDFPDIEGFPEVYDCTSATTGDELNSAP